MTKITYSGASFGSSPRPKVWYSSTRPWNALDENLSKKWTQRCIYSWWAQGSNESVDSFALPPMVVLQVFEMSLREESFSKARKLPEVRRIVYLFSAISHGHQNDYDPLILTCLWCMFLLRLHDLRVWCHLQNCAHTPFVIAVAGHANISIFTPGFTPWILNLLVFVQQTINGQEWLVILRAKPFIVKM